MYNQLLFLFILFFPIKYYYSKSPSYNPVIFDHKKISKKTKPGTLLLKYEQRKLYQKIEDTIRIKEIGKEGIFKYDPTDTTTPEDGALILIRDGKRYKRQYKGPVHITWFGAKGDCIGSIGTDNTSAFKKCFNKHKNVYIPGGNYKTSLYPRSNNIIVTTKGNVIISVFKQETQVMIQFGDNSRHSGIKFVSLEKDLEWQRAGIEQAHNVIIKNCGFFNFLNSTQINSWGLFLQNASNIVIDHCYFGNNSQSDIALVNNCKNIKIMHPSNIINEGVTLDIEPTDANGTKGAVFTGGNYKSVLLLENVFTAYASENLVFKSCKINYLSYDGSGVKFINCQIDKVGNENNQRSFAGNLEVNAMLSENLISNPKITDQNKGGLLSPYWEINTYYSKNKIEYHKDGNQTYNRLNASGDLRNFSVRNKVPIEITGKNPLLVFINGRAIIPKDAAWIGQNLHILWLDKNNKELSKSLTPFARGMQGDTTKFQNNYAILIPPKNAVKVIFEIGAKENATTIKNDIKAVGLFEVKKLGQGIPLSQISNTIINK